MIETSSPMSSKSPHTQIFPIFIGFTLIQITIPNGICSLLSPKASLSHTIRKQNLHHLSAQNQSTSFTAMSGCKKIEVHPDDQAPHKWCKVLGEDTFRRFLAHGGPAVHRVFGEGSLFSPFLFGKFFDPSDAFPLWEFESDILLSGLRSSGQTAVDWVQTEQDYVLKAEVPGVDKNEVQIYVEKGKVVEICVQVKLVQKESVVKDWRGGHWWEHGCVRRIELPEDADWRRMDAFLKNNSLLEVKIPKKPLDHDAPQAS